MGQCHGKTPEDASDVHDVASNDHDAYVETESATEDDSNVHDAASNDHDAYAYVDEADDSEAATAGVPEQPSETSDQAHAAEPAILADARQPVDMDEWAAGSEHNEELWLKVVDISANHFKREKR